MMIEGHTQTLHFRCITEKRKDGNFLGSDINIRDSYITVKLKSISLLQVTSLLSRLTQIWEISLKNTSYNIYIQSQCTSTIDMPDFQSFHSALYAVMSASLGYLSSDCILGACVS